MQQVKKAIVPVAGLGTRSLPFTRTVPKEMMPILNIPAIHFIVEELIQAGIELVVLVTSKGKSAIEDYFDGFSTSLAVATVRQKKPAGLGDAILCGQQLIGEEPFIVCLGDEIFPSWETSKNATEQMIESWRGRSVLGLKKVEPEEASRYGIVEVASEPKRLCTIRSLIEKPAAGRAPSSWAIVGRYLFTPTVFEALAALPRTEGKELFLTDAILALIEKEGVDGLALEGNRFDIGNAVSHLHAQLEIALRSSEYRESTKRMLKSLSL